MRFAFIDAQKGLYPLTLLCRVMQVRRSGFYAWLRRIPSQRARTDAQLGVQLRAAFQDSRGTYGSPRLCAQLRRSGVRISKRRTERLMRAQGLSALRKPRLVRTTDSRHSLPVAPNLLGRDFSAQAPNRVWVTDISAPQQAA